VFHNTGNGFASELLLSVQPAPVFESVEFWKKIIEPSASEQTQPRPKSYNRVIQDNEVFAAAKVGNVANLESLLNGIAWKAILSDSPSTRFKTNTTRLDDIIRQNLDLFRAKLENILLKTRDWSRKTVLHVAIYAKGLCVTN